MALKQQLVTIEIVGMKGTMLEISLFKTECTKMQLKKPASS
jgi:hypothetical protein